MLIWPRQRASQYLISFGIAFASTFGDIWAGINITSSGACLLYAASLVLDMILRHSPPHAGREAFQPGRFSFTFPISLRLIAEFTARRYCLMPSIIALSPDGPRQHF